MPWPPTMRMLLPALLAAGGSTAACAAGSGTLAVSAVVPSKNSCKFNSNALTLNFGSINPASSANATALATIVFRCTGSSANATFFISAGNGLHASGPGARRMQNTTIATEFLPYALGLSPSSATVPKNTDQTLTVTGTIQPFEFQNVSAGSYRDTVVLTITP